MPLHEEAGSIWVRLSANLAIELLKVIKYGITIPRVEFELLVLIPESCLGAIV